MKINIYENVEVQLKEFCDKSEMTPTKLANLLLSTLLDQHTQKGVMIDEILERLDRTRTNNTKN